MVCGEEVRKSGDEPNPEYYLSPSSANDCYIFILTKSILLILKNKFVFTTAFMIVVFKTNNKPEYRLVICKLKLFYKITLISISALLFFYYIFVIIVIGMTIQEEIHYTFTYRKIIALIPVTYILIGTICNMSFLYYLTEPKD